VSVHAERHEVPAAKRKAFIEGTLLRHVTEARVAAAGWIPQDGDGALGERREAQQDPQQRRLAGAVGTQHGEELAGRHLEVEVPP